MAHQLVLGTLLGASTPALPYTLNTTYEPQRVSYTDDAEPDLYDLQRKIRTANTVFGVGLVGLGAGAGVAAVGVTVLVVGVIPALFGDTEMLTTGLVIMAGGMIVATIAVPVAVTGALLGNVALRKAGFEVSSVPGVVAVGGLGLVMTGVAVSSSSDGEIGETIGNIGLIATGVGAFTQVFLTNKAFRTYKKQQTPQAYLHPVAPLDGYGMGMTVRF